MNTIDIFDFKLLKDNFEQIKDANFEGEYCRGLIEYKDFGEDFGKGSLINYIKMKSGDYSCIEKVSIYVCDEFGRTTGDCIEFGSSSVDVILDFVKDNGILK